MIQGQKLIFKGRLLNSLALLICREHCRDRQQIIHRPAAACQHLGAGLIEQVPDKRAG